MSDVYVWNDPSYVVIVDGGSTIWGQFNVTFLNGTSAPATEEDKDAYAKAVADDTKARYPDAAVYIIKETSGSKVDSEFYTSGS